MRLLTSVAVLALLAGPAVAQVSNPVATAADPAGFRDIDVIELEDTEVVSIEGEELGEIEDVVRGPNGNLFAVMEFGGFLDIGEEKRMVDLSRMYWRDNALILPGVTEAELEALPEWQDGMAGYTALDDDYEARVSLYEDEPVATGAIGNEPAIGEVNE
ncbi:PRC-barrel domain-containing protein [Microvirga sp. GCM10011540]|uniref:PRC-barrel domain-containing protein n=1 Tax=Microvirga sp. GCM10011540 TaxID=3317338 RepID=UPI00360E64F0